MKLNKKNRKAKAYILYRFPSLHIFYDGRRLFRVVMITATALLLCASFGYAVWGRPFTHNGVFDAVIATPIQTALLVALIGSFAWLRVLGYRRTSGIRDTTATGASGLILAFCDHAFGRIVFDCAEVSHITTMHPFIAAVLRFTVFDKEDLFRLEAGSLDVPKAALDSISLVDGDLVLKLRSTSFYDIFYTHYFADYPLSTQHIDENAPSTDTTLRSLFQAKAVDFIKHGVAAFATTAHMAPFPLLPNPLGVTGICRLHCAGTHLYILRRRKGDVINELNTHDWSFSGLVEAHTLMFPGDARRTASDYMINEMTDELLSQIGCCPIEIGAVTSLGIVFSAKYLCQPEFVVMVDIQPSQPENAALVRDHIENHADGNYSLVPEEYLRNLLGRGDFRGYKDIFPDVTRLLMRQLDSGQHAPRPQ